jgi:hypothetical protein
MKQRGTKVLIDHGLLFGAQMVCVLVIGLFFGGGPGLVAGFILGGTIFGFLQEWKEPGSMRGFFDNWRRALKATGVMVAVAVVFGLPALMLAILLTPSAAEDWKSLQADYGLSAESLAMRGIIVGLLAMGLISFVHLICTRLAFKIVASFKND